MKVIGLTGGIGSGKSTVSRFLEEMGAVLLDADKVGHEAYQPNTDTFKEVVAAFGEEIINSDGEIDRKKLGGIVFSNPEMLTKLNQIMHPRMFDMMKERIEQFHQQGVRVVVLEAAILIEAGWTPLVDEVWVTVASVSEVVSRAVKRTGLPEEQIRARIRSQLSNEQRTKNADVVIINDGSLDDLNKKVAGLWQKIKE